MSTVELARKLGVSYRQVDYWVRLGLVDRQHQPVGSGGHRWFTPDQVERVALLARAARIKQLSIGEIADHLARAEIGARHVRELIRPEAS